MYDIISQPLLMVFKYKCEKQRLGCIVNQEELVTKLKTIEIFIEETDLLAEKYLE